MYHNPEDVTRLRRLQKHFQSPHTKTKSPMISNYTRLKTEGQKRQTEVIKKQMINRMFMQKQLTKRSYNSNSPYSNGFSNNQHFVDHNHSSRRTTHRYQSNNSSRNSTTESQIRLRLSQRQNETLFQMLTKSEQQISILKQLLKQKQSAIHDKQKIIRRFIKQRVKYTQEEKYDNHVQDELLNSNITIQSLKAEILKHLATQNLMRQKIHSLQKKIPIIQFPSSMKDKQYQEIIKQKQTQLEKIQCKTLQLKTDCERVQNIKAQNSSLKQRLKTYQSQQTNNYYPSSPINRILNKFEQKSHDDKQVNNDYNYQHMITELKEKLTIVNHKLKQKQQEEYLKMQIHLKQQQISKLLTVSDNLNEIHSQSNPKKQEIQQLKNRIKQLQSQISQETSKLQQDLNFLLQQNKILTKKNTQFSQNIILNLSELDSIEKYNEEIKLELEQEKSKTKSNTQQIQYKNIELKRLLQEINKYKDLQQKNTEIKVQLQFLNKVNSELERRIIFNDKSQSDLQSLNQQQLKKISTLQNNNIQLQAKIKQQELCLTSNSINLELLTEQKLILSKSIEQLKSKYQVTLSSLQKSNQTLIQVQQSANNQITTLNSIISQQSITITLYQTKLLNSQKTQLQFQSRIQSVSNQLQTALNKMMSLQCQSIKGQQQYQLKLSYLNNEMFAKQSIIKEYSNNLIVLQQQKKQTDNRHQQFRNNKQREVSQIKNQNAQLLQKMEIIQQKNIEIKNNSNAILQQNQRLIQDNKCLVNKSKQLQKQMHELIHNHEQQTVELNYKIKQCHCNYSQLQKIHQQLLSKEQQFKTKIFKDKESQYIDGQEEEFKDKILENQRKYSQLLEQQNVSSNQIYKNKQQYISSDIKQNDNQQKIQKLVKQLSVIYHSDLKTVVLQCFTLQNIILVQQQKEENKRVETETTSLELDTNQICKTRIFEIVTSLLKNTALIDNLNKFLYDILEENHNILKQEKIIIQFCNSLKQFEDEVEKRLSKFNGFLKNSSDAFEFNSNIEQSDDHNSSIKDSNFDQSFKQDKIQECSISYQNYQTQNRNGNKDNNCSIQYQQSFKSLIPPKKTQFSLCSQTSIRPMSQHSKLSSIKLKLFEQDQKSGSQMVSQSSLSTNNFKNDYQKKLKNKLMNISRDPYKKGKKSKK